MFVAHDVRHLATCDSAQAEYWLHVSSQAELPIAGGVDPEAEEPEPTDVLAELNALAIEGLDEFSVDELVVHFADHLLAQPALLSQLRLLVAVSDKRLYLDLSYVFSRVRAEFDASRTLCGCSPHALTRHSTPFFLNMLKPNAPARQQAAREMARYFVQRGLLDILKVYSALPPHQRLVLVQKLIAPKEAQQNEAKRRGHGAEAAVASLLRQLGCKFVPQDKDINPMGAHDPNVLREDFTIAPRDPDKTFSFDLLVLNDADEVVVCMQGLVQSSDPGQFGVNKSDETLRIRERIDQFNAATGRSVQLWSIVDGVGYSENKEGTINKLLPLADTFVQMKSLYKVALKLHQLGLATVKAIRFDMDFYSEDTAAEMAAKYVPQGVAVLGEGAAPPADSVEITAGWARLYV